MARFAATVLCALLVAASGQRPTLEEHKAGKAAEAAGKDAAAANKSKSAAVEKAVLLLETLSAQVMKEGEVEAASYNEFACFCKDNTKEKTEEIQTGTDEQQELMAEIKKLSNDRDEDDDTIQDCVDDIKKTEEEVASAQAERAGTKAEFDANAADLKGAIFALDNAIKSLKGSKSPSLLQFQKVSDTVKTAALLADAMGLGSKGQQKSLAVFLQQPENGNAVPMEDYKFHSGDIIETLEQLLKDFKDEKNSVDADEVKSVKEFDLLMQEKDTFTKNTNKKMEDTKTHRDECVANIEMTSKELSTTEATLLENQEYMMQLAKMCRDKAITWDQRSRVRADELATLTQAIGIIKGTVSEQTASGTLRFAQQGVNVRLAKLRSLDVPSMDALEAEAEAEDGASFIQETAVRSLRGKKPTDGRLIVQQLLQSKGKELKSPVLSALASQITSLKGDPFAKIKTLIQELIERLLQEAAAEANQKGWCDKALSDATQKRDYSAEEVMTLNANLAKLEATRDKLIEELKVLAEEIEELKTKRSDASDERDEEKDENKATVKEAGEGLDAVQEAITVLEQFYGTAKNAEVDLSLAQKQPKIDAPDAGFDNGEAYKGAGGKAGGVIGMLEVIEGDFQRTISETEKAEKQAAQDHTAFMTETGKSLAEKEQAEKEKGSQKDDAETSILEDGESMTAQNGILKGAVKELIELQGTCIDTGMSYEERVARREEEMSSLKKALCIFENFEAYGPDASGAGVCE
mmetsp:Transcript_54427/g.160057  ORF Transcript_54427/g.160057 Transcript_54427/m.160057 type:complete len:750 (-) Transcript_54427:30-2279(-)